jgi:hypothetical protein
LDVCVLTRPTDAFAGFCGELRVGWLILDTRDPEAKGALDPGDFCSTSGRRLGPAAISSPSLREQRGPDLGVSSDLGRSGANWPRVVRSGPIWGSSSSASSGRSSARTNVVQADHEDFTMSKLGWGLSRSGHLRRDRPA